MKIDSKTKKVIFEPYERTFNSKKMNEWMADILKDFRLDTNKTYKSLNDEQKTWLQMFIPQYSRELYFKFTKDQYDRKIAKMSAKQGNKAQEVKKANKLSSESKKAETGGTVAQETVDIEDLFGEIFKVIGIELFRDLIPTKKEDK